MDFSGPIYNVIAIGIFREVRGPQFGRQDVGICPGGCLDHFAFETGNRLLENPPDSPALEIIYAPELSFTADVYFTLTGAKHQSVTLYYEKETGRSMKRSISHAEVYFAPAGSRISFGEKEYGFRTYLCWRKAVDVSSKTNLKGRKRGPFSEIAHWPDEEGRIRIVEGPEYRFLANPSDFTSRSWLISADSNEMGLRLIRPEIALRIKMGNMISALVSDGTVQLTPKGPIILLKDRQTIGGYPRIFNVIDADVDLLGQYAPGQCIRFKLVTIEAANAVARQKRNDLLSI